jgi:tRNA A-37 threonylcarbamoyl transferase component Bud32
MQSLGYFKDLKLQPIGKTYQLLSYTLLQGNMEPNNIEQIQAAKMKIDTLHHMNFVHGDIRIGNIVFCPSGNGAFLIDFDFTECFGCEYHEVYNRELEERHPDVRSQKTNIKKFCHDQYALNHIALKYFKEPVYPYNGLNLVG